MRYPARSRIWRAEKIMLLRQNLRRGHERDLVAVFDGDDRGLERHDCLADPTSPCSSRRIGQGVCMSVAISFRTLFCAAVG